MKTKLLALGCVLWAGPALALQPVGLENGDCREGSTQTQVECLALLHSGWDAKLTAAYQNALDWMDSNIREFPDHADTLKNQKAALELAQQHWLAFREANCEMYAHSGGSIARVLSNDCMARLTAYRAQELDELLRP